MENDREGVCFECGGEVEELVVFATVDGVEQMAHLECAMEKGWDFITRKGCFKSDLEYFADKHGCSIESAYEQVEDGEPLDDFEDEDEDDEDECQCGGDGCPCCETEYECEY